jgi:type IV pilus assembly protein PilW
MSKRIPKTHRAELGCTEREIAMHERGVTLIELMVGVAIGLVTTVVIAQVMLASDGRRRSLSSTSDAQVKSALALYTLQRDVMSAGYGFSDSPRVLGCTLRQTFAGARNTLQRLAPLTIVDGADGAPDVITTLSSTAAFSVPAQLSSGALPTGMFVHNRVGINVGDVLALVPQDWGTSGKFCTVFSPTGLGDGGAGLGSTGTSAGSSLTFEGGELNAQWNVPPAGDTLFPVSYYLPDDFVVNFGPLLQFNQYSIGANQALQLSQGNAANGMSPPITLYPDIVNLQAFYGRDTTVMPAPRVGDGTVDVYDNANLVTSADFAGVRSVRIVMAVRSGTREKEVVTTEEPLVDVGNAVPVAGSIACGSSQCLRIKLSFDGGTEWQHYRYRTYDTVMPMRNVIWNATPVPVAAP